MYNRVLIVISILILTSIVASAKDVGGMISSDTTWAKSDSPIVVKLGIVISKDATLTIEPGVVVKFKSGKSIQVDGTLIARGTEDEKVIFTSADSQEPGAWGSILFTSQSSSAKFDDNSDYIDGCIMEHCVIEYGDNPISINGSGPLIANVTVKNASGYGISIQDVYNWNPDQPSQVKKLLIRSSIVDGTSSTGIYIKNSSVIMEDVKVQNSGYGYNSWGDGISVNEYSDVILRNCSITGNQGSGISCSRGSVMIEGCTVSNNGIGIWLGGATSTIKNSEISDSKSQGIYIERDYYSGSSEVTIEKSTIKKNGMDSSYLTLLREVRDQSDSEPLSQC